MYAVPEVKVVSISVRELVGNKLTEPADVARFWADTVAQAKIYDPEKEHCAVYMLNVKNRVKGWQIVSQGIQNASLIHPREVFRPAVVMSAAAVILVHNHPSGDTTPSADDLKITRQLIEAGKILGIQLLDHLVIGDKFLSIRESGLVIFTD